MSHPLIRKADGTEEAFDPLKLRASLVRAGSEPTDAETITQAIEKGIIPGETTTSIYHRAFAMLKEFNRGAAARYTLRRALAELGPSGFPFEYFISELFKWQGYRARVGTYLKGKCAEHEIDLIAENDEKIIIGEVKFHNRSEVKSDLKVALYVQARYEDLVRNDFGIVDVRERKVENWLITNTKFTTNVVNYAKCSGTKLLGWSHPEKGNIQDLIDESKLQPLTILTTLTEKEKQGLMSEGVVLCKSLAEETVLREAGLPKNKHKDILEEAKAVCRIA